MVFFFSEIFYHWAKEARIEKILFSKMKLKSKNLKKGYCDDLKSR